MVIIGLIIQIRKSGDSCDNNWYGVVCNDAEGAIYELKLSYNDLSDTIPKELGNLSSLERLELQGYIIIVFNNYWRLAI